MSRETDLHINCAVRRVFVRHWIDLGQLVLRTTNGAVLLTGRLQRLRHATEELTAGQVLVIFTEIRRIQSVRRVTTNFENWANCNGIWKPVEAPAPAPHLLRAPVVKPEDLDLTDLMNEAQASDTGR